MNERIREWENETKSNERSPTCSWDSGESGVPLIGGIASSSGACKAAGPWRGNYAM